MIKGILVFLIVWLVVTILNGVFRSLSGAEQWSLIKTAAYTGLMAVIAFAILVTVVILF